MYRLTLSLCIALNAFSVLSLAQNPSGDAQKYALIIGVKGYPGFPEKDRLNFADEDAISFKRFIQTPEGGSFPEGNIRLLINKDATRDRIYEEMRGLGDRMNGNDLVYVFFSGHGSQDSIGYVYLMPYNAALKNPQGQGIRANQFLQDINAILSSRHRLIFIDACHAAAAISDGVAKGDIPSVSSTLSGYWKEAFKGQGESSTNMAFFSASANQMSQEDKNVKQGVFSYFLIKGLKGDADLDKNGVVTAGELKRYLVDKVEEYTSKVLKTEQTPMVSPSFNSQFPLAVLGKGA